MMRPKSKHLTLNFSYTQLLLFALFFAAVGGFLLYKSFALNPNLPGDVNNDNVVNVTDLSILLTNYNQNYTSADFNSDGSITILDLSILLSNYGRIYSGGGSGTAQIFISPNGNDNNNCSNSSPCRTLMRGIQASPVGGTVSLAGGSYPGETLTGDARGVTIAAASEATFTSRITFGGVSNLKITGPIKVMNDTYFDIMFRYCNRNVSISGFQAMVVAVFGGEGITIKDSSFGGYNTSGKSSDSVVSGGDSCSDNYVRNVTIDNTTFHDVFYNTPESQWGGAHPDCFEINGNIDGLIVSNSVFERCGNTFVGMYTDFGPIKNVTFEQNTFQEMGNVTYYGMQIRGESPYGCANVKIINNSYIPNNPDAVGPYSPPLFLCERLGSDPGVTVSGNTIQKGAGDGCSGQKSSPWFTIFSGNSYPLGGGCD